MEHGAQLIDVLDARGHIVGQKPRRAINKSQDIHHTIYTQLITPRGELVLSVIPPREDLPNLYSRQMGATVATMRRSVETSLEAALRGLSRELFIDKGEVQLLGRRMMHLPERVPVLVSAYYLVADPPSTFSLIDIDTLVVVTPRQLRNILQDHPNEIAPTLTWLWETYSHKLPI